MVADSFTVALFLTSPPPQHTLIYSHTHFFPRSNAQVTAQGRTIVTVQQQEALHCQAEATHRVGDPPACTFIISTLILYNLPHIFNPLSLSFCTYPCVICHTASGGDLVMRSLMVPVEILASRLMKAMQRFSF